MSTRTFNNYFTSQEPAIAWPATQHVATMAEILLGRPIDEPLGAALVEAVTGVYLPPRADGLPPHWLRDFRALVAREPALHGEYLKASQAAERALADAIARRLHLDAGDLRAPVAERTAAVAPGPVRRQAIRSLAVLAVPVIVYFAIRPAIGSDAPGLAIAGAVPLAYNLMLIGWRRRIGLLAVLTALGFALGCLASLLAGGSALPLKLHQAAVTFGLGTVLLAAVLLRRIIYGIARHRRRK